MTAVDLASIQVMEPTNAAPFSRAGWIFEFKYDGFRAIAGGGQLLSRTKKDASTRFAAIARAVEQLGDVIIDGEICYVDELGVPDFEGLLERRTGRINFYAFDLLFLGGQDLRGLPLLERKGKLRAIVPKNHPCIGYVDYVERAGEALYAQAVGMGLEGVVGKKADSTYRGGRTRLWLKAKPAGYHDGWKRRKLGSAAA